MQNNNPSNTPAENKMGVQPVGRLLAGMAVPMMISMLVQALYNVVDSIFVSRLSENALTAVSLAFPLQNLMIAVCAGTHRGHERPALPVPGRKRAGPKRTRPPTPASFWLCAPSFSSASLGYFSPAPSSSSRPT